MRRFDDRWLDVAGIRTRYWAAGTRGSPVLLLHGIGCSVLEWNKSLAAFGEHHHAVAIDLLGSGATDKPASESYTLRRIAEHVLGVARKLGLGPVHLAGNSLGGRLALECALIDPTAVKTLLLVDPAGVGRETFINFRLATLRGVGELLTRPNRAGLKMLWREAYFDPSLLEEARIDAKLADARQPGAQVAFLRTLRGFLAFGGFPKDQVAALHSAVRGVQQPTLIAWGRDDKLLPVAQGAHLQTLMPNARLEVFDRCGHLPQLEVPDAFNRVAMNFWAQHDTAHAGEQRSHA